MQQFGLLILFPEMKLRGFKTFHSTCVVGIVQNLVLKEIQTVSYLMLFLKSTTRTVSILEHFQVDPQNMCMFSFETQLFEILFFLVLKIFKMKKYQIFPVKKKPKYLSYLEGYGLICNLSTFVIIA